MLRSKSTRKSSSPYASTRPPRAKKAAAASRTLSVPRSYAATTHGDHGIPTSTASTAPLDSPVVLVPGSRTGPSQPTVSPPEHLSHCVARDTSLTQATGQAFCLDCYQCNSTLDHNCQEKFVHNMDKNPLRSGKCTEYGALYCIKITGLWGGIVGTHRFCSSRDLGNQCQDLSYPDHDRIYRACVYTCGSDDCNSAATYFSTTKLFSFIVLGLLVSLKTYFV